MRIALFATCLADTMFPQAAQATVSILERLGHEVFFPPGQVCCGQMHANTGYFAHAARITRNHVETFSPVLDGQWDAIVIPSGSCTGAARHEQKLVAEHVGDAALAARVEQIAAHTYDLSELLTDVLGLEDVGAYFPHTVTYHPTCHSMRVAGVGDRPYRLLRAVEGLTLIDLPDAEVCCGFGGTFSVKNSETSTAMLADKMSAVMSTRAEILCAGDYSCLMHIGGGLSRVHSGVRIMHLAEILASTKEAPFEGNISFAPRQTQPTQPTQPTSKAVTR
ncbi:(Fe-S)-binding protein [Actinomyces slackii]|uniref:Lactate utilization protein A n=2 Tax=Actinomyces slackii TaxID=52774 RepID=A0A3S4UN39_9ACTO|nr:(Fe-S)-binding protein [Actinomyces slackii]VEG74387.1 Lactate utilization protein A [Actinomyces slackii]